MVFISALLALFLGRRWVAVPVQRLMELTHRVGRGDFTAAAHVNGSDEIAHLAQPMNRMSADLERAMEQLRHADRLNTVGKLSSGVAHELGTPLHVALGRAKAICADADSPQHIYPPETVAVILASLAQFLGRADQQILDYISSFIRSDILADVCSAKQ